MQILSGENGLFPPDFVLNRASVQPGHSEAVVWVDVAPSRPHVSLTWPSRDPYIGRTWPLRGPYVGPTWATWFYVAPTLALRKSGLRSGEMWEEYGRRPASRVTSHASQHSHPLFPRTPSVILRHTVLHVSCTPDWQLHRPGKRHKGHADSHAKQVQRRKLYLGKKRTPPGVDQLCLFQKTKPQLETK